jgi:hypothetical protein
VTLSVLVEFTVTNKAALDVPVGLVVTVEAALGRTLDIRAHYSGLGGACPAPYHHALGTG